MYLVSVVLKFLATAPVLVLLTIQSFLVILYRRLQYIKVPRDPLALTFREGKIH